VLGLSLSLILGLATPATPDALPIIILSQTGVAQDGTPIVRRASDDERYVKVLTSGFSGRLLRLYALAQRFSHPERPLQPAYLVLSDTQGGFPRWGFQREGVKYPEAAYVDLHRDKRLTGPPAAIDQIFPHELLHIIVHELAGEMPAGGANQVHAIGVKTDRVVAFNEGFAEHAQIMAIDDPDAAADTRVLAASESRVRGAYANIAAYRRALDARWVIAPRAVAAFPLWFSGAEQVLRYDAVKRNLFAREPKLARPPRDLHRAYLLENILPGDVDGPAKSAARMLVTEGVVAALFWRIAAAGALQASRAPEAFYQQFGVRAADLSPIENGYVKLFAAIREGRHDAAAVVRAYVRLFPRDAEPLDSIVRDVLLGQPLPSAPAIWLWNERFTVGTTVFDQYRRLPRAHAFDINAASETDLLTVPGMSRARARAILARVPVASIDDLRDVDGMTGTLAATLRDMHEMALRQQIVEDEEETLSISSILMPYVWRALAVILVCAAASASLYRAVRRARTWRVVLNGIAASLLGLAAAWLAEPVPGVFAFGVPVILFGLPAASVALWRTRSGRAAITVLGAWMLASLPAVLAVTPVG
jgi:hypothetical protein